MDKQRVGAQRRGASRGVQWHVTDVTVQHGHFQIVDLSTTDDYAVSDEDLAEIALKGEEVAAAKLLHALGDDHGFDIEVYRDWETMVRVMGARAREAV